jgi:hypothetical protein
MPEVNCQDLLAFKVFRYLAFSVARPAPSGLNAINARNAKMRETLILYGPDYFAFTLFRIATKSVLFSFQKLFTFAVNKKK